MTSAVNAPETPGGPAAEGGPPQRPAAGRRVLRGWFGRLPWYGRLGVVAGVAVLAYLMPYLGNVPFVGPQLVTQGVDWPSALFNMSYYVLLAVGLNVVVGFAGLLDLGYVGFFAIGAYTVGLVTSPDSVLHWKWGWVAAVPVAIGLVMLSGLLLGWPTLRLRGDYLAIVTLGFAEIIYKVASVSNWPLKGDNGITGIAAPPGHLNGQPIFGVRDATPFYWLGLTMVIIVILGVRNLDRSRVGRSWLAIREDEEAAELMGVRTIKYKLWAFAIGAAVAGFSGVLFAGEQGFVNNQSFILQFSVLVLAGVVMGGSGNIAGAILGGALISYIPDRLAGQKVFGADASQLRYVLFGAAILLIMIFRPQGLIPSRRRALELKDRKQEVAPQ
jgi:branched-chain amino acid transport system permease protein